MKKLVLLNLLLLCGALFTAVNANAGGATIIVSSNMNWSALTGGTQLGGQPTQADTVIVNNNATLTVDIGNATCQNLQLGDSTNASGNGTLTFNSGGAVVVANNGQFPPLGTLTIGVAGGGAGSIDMANGGSLAAETIVTGNAGTWTPAPTPTGATIFIGAGTITPADLSFFTVFNNLSIVGGDTSSPNGTYLGGPLVVTGNFEIYGYCNLNDSGGYNITVAGNVSFDGQNGGGVPNFIPGTSTMLLNGSTYQQINNNDTSSPFYNLTISNSAGGVTSSGYAGIVNTLTMAGGILTMNGNYLIFGPSGSGVASASSYVIGAEEKYFAVGNNQSVTFPIGQGADYAPITLTGVNVNAAGFLVATTTAGQHPQIASSGINAGADVSRYWTLTNSSGGIAITSYNATFNYPAADLESGTAPASFIARQWTGSAPWTNLFLDSTPASNAVSVSVSNAVYGDFAVGNPSLALVSSQNPSPLAGAVTLTATVAGPPAATGNIVFMDGSNTLGIGTLNASGVANFSTAALAATNSPHVLTAYYAGDSNHTNNTSGVLFQVVNAPIALAISNSDFQADILADGAVTNIITGWEGITSPGTDFGAFNPQDNTFPNTSLNTVGNSAGNLPPPGVGVNCAYLSGATIYQTLSNLVTANTTYTLSGALGLRLASGGGSTNGAAPVSAALLAAATNGDVLAGGTNSFVIPEPAQGTFDAWSLTYVSPVSSPDIGQPIVIELISSGTGFNTGGQADFSDIQLVSGGLSTTTLLASSPDPSSNSSAVTFTATVTSPAGTTQPTNGTVTFMDGTVTLGAAPLNASGVATVTNSSLANGANTVTAIFGGSGIYAGSISSNLSQIVGSGGVSSTTTTVASSTGGTSSYGQPVSFSATVTGSDGGGTVAFYADGSASPIPGCSAIALTSGVATTPNITNLAVGSNAISATYSGDIASASSTGSLTGGQTVTLDSQTITFGSLSNKTYGAVPFSISAMASSGLPVGFAVASGPASITGSNVTITGAGTVAVQASQPGNSNYSAATPVTNSFTVNPLAVVLKGSRAYDGTSNAAFGILSVSNVVGSDNVTVASGSATLAGAGVGTQAIVSAGTLALGGTNAVDYTLSGATGLVTITNPFNPFSITSSSLDSTGTNFVVCWQSVPGVAYNVLTNTTVGGPGSWAIATGPITATNTTTCCTLPGGIVGKTEAFVLIEQ